MLTSRDYEFRAVVYKLNYVDVSGGEVDWEHTSIIPPSGADWRYVKSTFDAVLMTILWARKRSPSESANNEGNQK